MFGNHIFIKKKCLYFNESPTTILQKKKKKKPLAVGSVLTQNHKYISQRKIQYHIEK